jgi:hypothetical protein
MRFSIESSKRKVLAVTLAGACVLAALTIWHLEEKKSIEDNFIQVHMATVVQSKQRDVEFLFGNLYQNLRTISLLPSVRNISGANRAHETEDVVAAGRFTAEGQQTVQQIYNNLHRSTNVRVSEVYAVLDGLDAGKNEVPFFMYDTMILDDAKPPAQAQAAKGADIPLEEESAEYAYFPRQMDLIKKSNAVFNFTDPEQIPAFASPMMRTCDNTQYPSLSKGHVSDTFGMLYSVPFYDAKSKKFRGVISGILRSNVVEALLMGVPWVPVTLADQEAQRQGGWSLPQPAHFLLSNAGYGVNIMDRRDTELPGLLEQGVEGRNTFHIKLNIKSDSPWVLNYYLPEALLENATRESDRRFNILIVVVLFLVFFAL